MKELEERGGEEVKKSEERKSLRRPARRTDEYTENKNVKRSGNA